jgi:large subunit ribosomal protein L4
VAHGPKSDKNYTRTVTKQMKRKALAVILSKKYKDGEVLFVDALSLPTGKTKDAKVVLSSLGGVKGFEAMPTKRANAMLLALSTNDNMVKRGFKNLGNLSIEEVRNMNPLHLMQYRYLTIVGGEKALESLTVKK